MNRKRLIKYRVKMANYETQLHFCNVLLNASILYDFHILDSELLAQVPVTLEQRQDVQLSYPPTRRQEISQPLVTTTKVTGAKPKFTKVSSSCDIPIWKAHTKPSMLHSNKSGQLLLLEE